MIRAIVTAGETRLCSVAQPIRSGCCLSIPPENLKRKGFLMFSGVIDKQYQAVMG